MDPEKLERARVICEALSRMPGFSATLTQQAPPTHTTPTHTHAAPSTSAQPQGAPQTTHTHSAAGASTQPRRGATQSAPRGGIPAALSRYRPIKPKPAPPSFTSTSAAPSPVPSNAAPPLFPALPGLPSIPAGPLPPLPPPPVPVHTVLPLATGHGPFGLLAPFTMFGPPAMRGQPHASAQPAPLAMSAHWTTQQVPPPPAPAASTLPPAPVSREAASSTPQLDHPPPATAGAAAMMPPRVRPAARQTHTAGSATASTSTSGGHPTSTHAGQPLDCWTEASNNRKRARADEPLDTPVSKRAATDERRHTLSLDSAESGSSVGPRVQSRNNILSQQHSHALQISPPPQATGAAPPSAPIENGSYLPTRGSVHRAAGAAQAASAPAPAPAVVPAPAPAPAPAAGPFALAAAGGVRGTTVGKPAAVKRTTAVTQPGSRGAQPPAAPAGHSGNAAASGSRPRASAAQSPVAIAGPSHPPPAAQGGAATADDEDEDEETDEDEENDDDDECGRKKGKGNKKKRIVNQATNAQASLQAGLKWYSWMAS